MVNVIIDWVSTQDWVFGGKYPIKRLVDSSAVREYTLPYLGSIPGSTWPWRHPYAVRVTLVVPNTAEPEQYHILTH